MPFRLTCAVLLLAGLFATGYNRASAAPDPAPTGAAKSAFRFTRLFFADSEAKAAALQAGPDANPVGAVLVEDVPILATPEFADFVKPYFGQPITTETVNRLANDVVGYLRRHDRPVVKVLIPTQEINRGEFRLAVLIGRYKELQFQGNRWFSRALLESKLGIKPGDEVRLTTLEEAANWANTNPFRQVKMLVNDTQGEQGWIDLIVNVQEAMPVRAAFSYDNTGNALLGPNHYTASIQFGNLWGLDHQASYQFTTSGDPRTYQAHSGDYRVPLPWHHYLQFTGAYSTVTAEIAGGDFALKGKSTLANLRYIAPVERGVYSLEFSGGLDFKQTNNDLEYGNQGSVFASKVDIFQLNLGATVVRHDQVGAWVFGATLSLSPGNLNARNSDATFAVARPNGYALLLDANGNQLYNINNGVLSPAVTPIGQSRYAYGTLSVQRLTKLPAGFQLFSRGQFQVSSANLISTEQMSLGGQGTVRGYDERITAGDEGYLLSHELQGPEWRTPLSVRGRKLPPMQSRLIAFWDFGKVWAKHPLGATEQPLMSVGLGVRCNAASNFNLAADYGWQLLETTPKQPDHGRACIKATLAY